MSEAATPGESFPRGSPGTVPTWRDPDGPRGSADTLAPSLRTTGEEASTAPTTTDSFFLKLCLNTHSVKTTTATPSKCPGLQH